ncbi:unnamed protein product [Candidula unifasciata]|uniref:Uncharacterized protein n=1 Tax=Candidula unifasciata TaxID=100452 RepID=A0A8S3YGB2_9EUPU|nr:unnamed protein product [Candidula unifasciata]
MAAQTTADEVCKLAYEGNFGILRIKLENYRSLASKKDTESHADIVVFVGNVYLGSPLNNALMIASSAGRTQIVYDLLGHGAQVNAVNNNGQSSLHYAASKGHLEICEALVKYGADIECVDSLGHTPLHRAASRGNLSIVKFLIAHDAPLDLRDATGCTPLHLACEDGNGEVARLLIDHGARTDIRNNEKQTAFELAPRALKRSLQSSLDR